MHLLVESFVLKIEFHQFLEFQYSATLDYLDLLFEFDLPISRQLWAWIMAFCLLN